MSGHRTYLGAGVSVTDNGIALDPRAVRGILHDKHTLRKRRDAKRYDVSNPEYIALVKHIAKEGVPPSPVLFRKVGLLERDDPTYQYLLERYPEKVAKQPDQPCLELVYGNRRLYALLDAMKQAMADVYDFEPLPASAKLLAVHRPYSDEEAERAFVSENANRARTSVYEDHLTVRARLKQGMTWEDLASDLHQPEKELRRTHEPLRNAHMAVVQAYSAGSITRGYLLRVIKLDIKQQPDALEDESLVPAAPKRVTSDVKILLNDVPVKEIQAIVGGNLDPDNVAPVRRWLKALPRVK